MLTFVTQVKRDILEEFHKPARVIRIFLVDLMEDDLVDAKEYFHENNGYKCILVVINCFSKYVWIYRLKTKTVQGVSTI